VHSYPITKGLGCGWKGEREQERVKEVEKWREIWRGGGTLSEGLLAKWMQGRKQG